MARLKGNVAGRYSPSLQSRDAPSRQAHAILTVLGVTEPDPLDLLIMLREQG